VEEKKMVIVITFKKNEKWIYDEVQKHSGKGNWIKDILKEYLVEKMKRPEGQ
jgi:hypothetical protein